MNFYLFMIVINILALVQNSLLFTSVTVTSNTNKYKNRQNEDRAPRVNFIYSCSVKVQLVVHCTEHLQGWVSNPSVCRLLMKLNNKSLTHSLAYHSHTWSLQMGRFHGLTGTAVGHWSIAPGFKPRPGYIGKLFHLSLRLVTCRSAHLAYLVHRSGHKTPTFTTFTWNLQVMYKGYYLSTCYMRWTLFVTHC